ncbi:MAG: hypothetical protein ABSE15_09815 [Candidatus Bathyarchaeia archaeon]
MEVAKRRSELLKLEGLGYSQAEIIKQLSEKNGCAERTLYNDFETRASWQPYVQCVTKPEDVLFKITNRYEQIYRQASLRMLSSNNPIVQLGALNTMLKVNSMMYETLVLPDLVYRLKALEKRAANGVFVP